MPDDFAQLVKQQADIVRIVGEYLKLRKTGAQNYTGLCPFHKEKTGSFSVNASTAIYYCFGCHEKGDVFNFVMKMDGLSFPEAVRAVATKGRNPAPQARVQLARSAHRRSRPAPPAHRHPRGRDAVLRGRS
jgi:DNA primase